MIWKRRSENHVPDNNAAQRLRGGPDLRRILTYHEIEPEKSNYLYAVTARQLDEHLRLVVKQNPNEPMVTFDDGHVSNFEVARPVLERNELKATFFVTVCRVGTHPKTMSWSQLRAFTDSGHSVQSHGWSHTFLIHCSPAQLREELSRSKIELEDRTGVLVDSISVPGGRWNAEVLRAAGNVGYRFVYTSDFLCKVAVKEGVQVAGRLMVRNNMSVAEINRWLSTDKDSLRMMGAKVRLKQVIRCIAGDDLYHRLWCRLAVSEPSNNEETNH